MSTPVAGVELGPAFVFDGQALAAMRFYERVFGGDLTVVTFAEAGVSGGDPERLYHSNLASPLGFTLRAHDVNGVFPAPPTTMGLTLVGTNGQVLRDVFHQLSTDGCVLAPLATQHWGDEYGIVTDQFDVTWQINISPQT